MHTLKVPTFGAAGRAGAEKALKRGRAALEAFAEEVYAREGAHGDEAAENDEPA